MRLADLAIDWPLTDCNMLFGSFVIDLDYYQSYLVRLLYFYAMNDI